MKKIPGDKSGDVILSTLVHTNISETLYSSRPFHKPETAHYRREDSRWKRERGHRGLSPEATNMMVELSQCHADKRWGKFDRAFRTNTVRSSYVMHYKFAQLFVGGSGGGLQSR
uniref:Uncharacterized protein n=1 Tax=Salix viminalis TaxID=40686 RepID=A0A6N2NDJ9_SALVM